MHIFKYKYVSKVSFLDLSIPCGPSSLIMAASYWRSWEPTSDSIHKGGCLCTPNMALKNWRILEGYLSSVYLGNLKNLVLIWVEICFSNRIDELVSESKRKQEKGKVSVFNAPAPWYHMKILPILRVGVLTSTNLIKIGPQRSDRWLVLFDSRYSQIDNQN